MKNKTTKTAIFGGSFNPPHFGHVDIVRNLERRFDRVIVMPSYISPFKSAVDDGKVRYALCKKVFASQKTEVSRYEISKKGVSYSVDTAAYLSKRLDGMLFWVIGSEEVKRLLEWHDIDKLKTLVTFYVVPRPNYELDATAVKALKKRKIKIKLAPFTGLDISSTVAKIDIAFGKPNRYLPTVVYDCIEKTGMFNPYGKYVDGLYDYGLNYRRIEHTYRTAVRGAQLAKLYGANTNDAVIACILHDIAKAQNASDYEDKADLNGFPAPTVHGPIGAYIAKQKYNVSDEIAQAITYHSTARADMTVLDEILYLADKTEDGRNYNSLMTMRALSEHNKNIAMLAALKEIRGLEHIDTCAFSEQAIEYYENIVGGEFDSAVSLVTDRPKKASAPEVTEKDKQKPPKKFVPSGDEIRDIATIAAAELSLHKARNVDIVSLNGKTIIADYFVIASASSTTAVKALMGYVEDKLTKQFGINPNKRDINAEWIALDYGGVIIHIFTDKTREFYNIERLWADGKNIERYED
ncbi:MAG: ribosome silencing factor [Clostridiales bacterium]|nr:ribosome silencing factor [Clostridiales bacterium]